MYGVTNSTIYTDHQSLICPISEKISNTKSKRCTILIEKYGAKLVYKHRHQNVVADSLSRQKINNRTAFSPNKTIKLVKQSLNSFKNQIILLPDNKINEVLNQTTFSSQFIHTIFYLDTPDLLSKQKTVIRPKVTNAILCHLKNEVISAFPNCTLAIAQNLLTDVTSSNEQKKSHTAT